MPVYHLDITLFITIMQLISYFFHVCSILFITNTAIKSPLDLSYGKTFLSEYHSKSYLNIINNLYVRAKFTTWIVKFLKYVIICFKNNLFSRLYRWHNSSELYRCGRRIRISGKLHDRLHILSTERDTSGVEFDRARRYLENFPEEVRGRPAYLSSTEQLISESGHSQGNGQTRAQWDAYCVQNLLPECAQSGIKASESFCLLYASLEIEN